MSQHPWELYHIDWCNIKRFLALKTSHLRLRSSDLWNTYEVNNIGNNTIYKYTAKEFLKKTISDRRWRKAYTPKCVNSREIWRFKSISCNQWSQITNQTSTNESWSPKSSVNSNPQLRTSTLRQGVLKTSGKLNTKQSHSHDLSYRFQKKRNVT